ncbi:hypothetical protein [Planctobacterium marinum]|uniref:hypothetical protein n=2 Tax=Planctobacterium marinum TaxID=1631968 RepID=UPI001E56E398|nr:hypothetical protein [Planctobacterium marinum]MCC2604777.1 hypothetical protein [Planctobacterium marinum]
MKMLSTKTAISCMVLASLVGSVNAQETANSTASVTIQNSFTLAESQALSFGTITVQGEQDTDATLDGTVQAQVTVFANGSTPTSGSTGTTDTDAGDRDASATIITAGQPAIFDISGAAAFTTLTISVPADDSVTLSAPSAPPTNGTFTITGADLYDNANGTDIAVASDAGSITTDASGAAQFAFGAVLNTEDATGANTTSYIDETYTGSYSITVSY